MAVHTVTLAHVIHGGRHNIKQGNADGFENASAARPLLLDSIVFAQQQWENDHSRAQVVKNMYAWATGSARPASVQRVMRRG